VGEGEPGPPLAQALKRHMLLLARVEKRFDVLSSILFMIWRL